MSPRRACGFGRAVVSSFSRCEQREKARKKPRRRATSYADRRLTSKQLECGNARSTRGTRSADRTRRRRCKAASTWKSGRR
eukprot:31304-Pelagococcus_subviridis.AAC.24